MEKTSAMKQLRNMKVRKRIAQEIDCSLYQPKRLRAIWEYHETSANAESCYCAMLHLFCCHEVSIRHAAYWSGNLIVDAIFDTKLYGYRMISEAVGTSNVSNIQGALQWFQIATMWNNNEKPYLVCSTILIHPAETSPFAMYNSNVRIVSFNCLANFFIVLIGKKRFVRSWIDQRFPGIQYALCGIKLQIMHKINDSTAYGIEIF